MTRSALCNRIDGTREAAEKGLPLRPDDSSLFSFHRISGTSYRRRAEQMTVRPCNHKFSLLFSGAEGRLSTLREPATALMYGFQFVTQSSQRRPEGRILDQQDRSPANTKRR